MPPPLRKVINRISQTSWDEVRTRLSQELTKRGDYALYRAGLLSEPDVLPAPGRDARFFFDPGELTGRVALIKERVPEAVEDTIIEAGKLLQHRFDLLGYRDLNYGADIDWHLDAVHGKRAPLKPWYKIRFLDFESVGDHKVTWELNRHQHLVTLAKAWAFTGDKNFASEVAVQFYSWQKANPYPLGINWGSSLEVAFRSQSWLWIRNLFKSTPGLPESFDRDLLRGLARNGRYIETFLSTYFSPNTHLIGEAVALFFIGTLCPEIPAAEKWRDKGLSILTTEAERQVRPDGVYFEQSLYYHVYALDFFLHARALAACNRVTIPESFDATLRKMLDVVRALAGNGPPDGFGDDDGGRVFNPRRNRVEQMSDPLALGAALFRDARIRDTTAITEEAIWLFGESAVAAGMPLPSAKSTAFPDGGLYLMASDGAKLLIDAGPHGAGSGGHGHADALSVQLAMNGKRWLIDPGSYVYVASSDERGARDEFRGTGAHNTLHVDAADQAVPQTPFSWSSLPEVSTDEWISAPRFDFFSGKHNGYMRLSDPVVHRRMIFHPRGEYWLVRDIAEGRDVHDLEISWHFATDLQLVISGEEARATDSTGASMVLLSAAAAPWELSADEGSVSPAYGEKHKAPVCVLRSRTQLPAEHATLLLAQRGSDRPEKLQLLTGEGCTAYAYGATDFFAFGNAADWSFGAFRGNARFLFVRGSDEPEALFVVGASFLEWNGQAVFRSEKLCGWLQWNRDEGAIASDPMLPKFFDTTILRAGPAVTLKQ